MAGKMPTGLNQRRSGWASKNEHYIAAQDATGAVRLGNRVYGGNGWYAVSAIELHDAPPSMQRHMASLGQAFFAVHFHRSGYTHLSCKGAWTSLSTSQRREVAS